MRARAVVAYVGGLTLANLAGGGSGIEAPRVDAGRVAVALGCEPQAANTALRRAVAEGWLTRVGGERPGVAGTFRLPQLRGAAVTVADDRSDLIDALAGAGEHPTASVILSVGHAAWGYSSLGHRAWAVALADATEVDPATVLGVPARAAATLRRDLIRAGVPAGGPSFAEALDRIASTADSDGGWSSPATRQVEAEQRRTARAAERTAEVARHRSEQAGAREAARAERTADRARDRATQRTTVRAGPAVRPNRTAQRTVALPGWWAAGPDMDRLQTELAQVRPDLIVVGVRDGCAIVEAATAA
ncbi:histone H1/H5 family protein [Cellulosimicrobium cellulans]|uniref:histone H1/H5 family protein n=1 Tax=Cellulosimicrobium cellulans TaxID=1710 RepID=UPI00130EC24F|nr:histone H1/H5 family protein [Cellulosimicrobium cellulans]